MRFASETEHIFATNLNITAQLWEKACKKHKSVPWWRPIKKLRWWREVRHYDKMFKEAMEKYGQFLEVRDS